MAITVADNFSYQGKKPLDGRDTFATLAAMKAYAEASVYDGCLSYCDEDGKRYEFKSTNTVDPTTGKWREYSSGGGGQTYNDFTGATSSTAGAHGLVPAPSAGDEGKVLFGNGTWGALPSVDLSVLSNEAFQFSPTEKPVGTWTDDNNVTKLLYQKVITNVARGSIIATNVDNVAMFNVCRHGVGADSAFHAISDGFSDGSVSMYKVINGDLQYTTWGSAQIEYDFTADFIIAQYTKTTDSPLPSDVKFTGVTSSGEVILKKEITLGTLPNNSTKQVAHGITNIGRIWLGEAYGITASKVSVPLPFMNVQGNQYNIQVYVDSTNINIVTASDNTAYSGYATVYYTLAS